MLEIAVIRRTEENGGISVPRLLDTLLYYGKVQLILDVSGFMSILEALGPANTKTLLSHPSVSTIVTPELTAIYSFTQPDGKEIHSPRAVIIGGIGRPLSSPLDVFYERSRHVQSLSQMSRDLMFRILSKTKKSNYGEILHADFNDDPLFRSMISDKDTVKLAISKFAESRGLNLSDDAFSNFEWQISRHGDGYVCESNVPIDRIIPRQNGEEKIWAGIMALIQDYEIDMRLSQDYSGDLIARPTALDFAQLRMDLAISRSSRNQDAVSSFNEFVFEEGSLLGRAFEAGAVTFTDALKIIDKAAKFREWLNGLPPNPDLIREYHNAITKGTILENPIARGVRFTFMTGGGLAAGLINPAVGIVGSVTLGLFDTFVLEGLIRGWRPSVFTDDIKARLQNPHRGQQ